MVKKKVTSNHARKSRINAIFTTVVVILLIILVYSILTGWGITGRVTNGEVDFENKAPITGQATFSDFLRSFRWGSSDDDSSSGCDDDESSSLGGSGGGYSSLATTCTSITQYGITWKFGGVYECGQFINGDNWVKTDLSTGSVKIISIDPPDRK